MISEKCKKTLLFVMFLLAAGCYIATHAQGKTFTLDEAINTALQNNRDLVISKMSIKKAESAVGEAFGYALPSVDLSANLTHFMEKPKTPFPDFSAMLGNATYSILFDENILARDEDKFKPMGYSLQSFTQANSYETSVQVTQTLFNSAVFRGIGASQIYLDLAKEDYTRMLANTILNVKKAFYGVLLTKELLQITRESYINAQDNLKNVNALYKQGLVSEFDALQAEVNVENIKPAVKQIENTLLTAKDGLKMMLGLNQNETLDVTGELLYMKEEIPAEEEYVNYALENNYAVKSLKLKMDVDEAFIDLDRSEYWPSLYAFGNYTYAGSADDWKFTNYSSSMVGVSLKMNLFMGQQTKKRVEQGKIALQQTEQQFFQYKDFVSTEVKSKLNELKKVEETIAAQERNITLAEKAYHIAEVRYKEGTGSQLEVQNADMALRQAKTNRLQSVYDYITARAALDELEGKIDPKYQINNTNGEN